MRGEEEHRVPGDYLVETRFKDTFFGEEIPALLTRELKFFSFVTL
jgi:hypothetical protein